MSTSFLEAGERPTRRQVRSPRQRASRTAASEQVTRRAPACLAALVFVTGVASAQGEPRGPVEGEVLGCPAECAEPRAGGERARTSRTPDAVNDGTTGSATGGIVTERLARERVNALNPYLFTTHKRNFIQPISYTSNLNDDRYRALAPGFVDELRSEEVRFQLSLKVRLNADDLLFPDDGVYFGFTIESWWQLYSKGVSAPFRETNYQPEVFYLNPIARSVLGGNVALVLGLEHQSNGQIQGFSRSWNRVYAAALYGRGRFVAAIRPWYRLPEDDKDDPLDPRGDDNPDILDFYGHGEVTLGWRGPRREYALSAHGNPSTGKGGGEIAVSFPAFGRFRGVVTYFNGYGDSLIDYDHFQQRLGAGLLLSNLF